MSVSRSWNHEDSQRRWTVDRNESRRSTLQALCLGAALEIVNLLDADGADHTYTAQDLAAVIYKNIHADAVV